MRNTVKKYLELEKQIKILQGHKKNLRDKILVLPEGKYHFGRFTIKIKRLRSKILDTEFIRINQKDTPTKILTRTKIERVK